MNPANSQPPPRSFPWSLAVTVMFLAALAAGYLIIQQIAGWRAVSFKTTVANAILATVERARAESKLVVYTFDVRAEVLKENDKVVSAQVPWVGNIDLPLGTTRVALRSSGNRVQCVIPLAEMATNWFSFAASGEVLTLKVPKPMIDDRMVEVQTDPRFVELKTDVGWARLDSRSGAHLREEARTALRAEVLREARRRLALDYHQDASRSAEAAVRRFMAPLQSVLGDRMKLVVQFE
jgi:hypothetical protein